MKFAMILALVSLAGCASQSSGSNNTICVATELVEVRNCFPGYSQCATVVKFDDKEYLAWVFNPPKKVGDSLQACIDPNKPLVE